MIDRSRQAEGHIVILDDGDPVDQELKGQLMSRIRGRGNVGPWRDPEAKIGDVVVEFENERVAARYGLPAICWGGAR